MGAVLSRVSYTGTGILTIRDHDHRPASSTAEGTAQPTEDTSPLSHATLFKALSGKETVWKDADANPKDLTGDGLSYESEGRTTILYAKSIGANAGLKENGNYIYWGLWDDSTTEPGSGKVTYGSYGAVMGGGKPYGKKPESSIESATYEDANAIVHYRKSDKDEWKPLSGSHMATLNANFSTGKIGGKVATPDTFGTVTGPVGNIFLRDADIGSDGKFSGMAQTASSKRQNGQWNGGFFGDTTGIEGSPRKTVPEAPSHASATFSVNRPEIMSGDTKTQDALVIRGAFGSGITSE